MEARVSVQDLDVAAAAAGTADRARGPSQPCARRAPVRTLRRLARRVTTTTDWNHARESAGRSSGVTRSAGPELFPLRGISLHQFGAGGAASPSVAPDGKAPGTRMPRVIVTVRRTRPKRTQHDQEASSNAESKRRKADRVGADMAGSRAGGLRATGGRSGIEPLAALRCARRHRQSTKEPHLPGNDSQDAPAGRDSRTRRSSRHLEAERIALTPQRCPGRRVRAFGRRASHGRPRRSRVREPARPTMRVRGRDEASRAPTANRGTISSRPHAQEGSTQSLASGSSRPSHLFDGQRKIRGRWRSLPRSVESNNRIETPKALRVGTPPRNRARKTVTANAYDPTTPTDNSLPTDGRQASDRGAVRAECALLHWGPRIAGGHPESARGAPARADLPRDPESRPAGPAHRSVDQARWQRDLAAHRESLGWRRQDVRAGRRGWKTPQGEAAKCSSPPWRRQPVLGDPIHRTRLRGARRAGRNDLLRRDGHPSPTAPIELRKFAPLGRLPTSCRGRPCR